MTKQNVFKPSFNMTTSKVNVQVYMSSTTSNLRDRVIMKICKSHLDKSLIMHILSIYKLGTKSKEFKINQKGTKSPNTKRFRKA